MVGLLASEVRESKERVRAALHNVGINLPIGRITVSLSPANVRKEGSGFDLPIAVSLLCIMGIIDYEYFKEFTVLGELGLDGVVKQVRGVLPIVNMLRKKGIKKFIIPKKNINELIIFDDIEFIAIEHISELLGEYKNNLLKSDDVKCLYYNKEKNDKKNNAEDFSDIIGQESAKRAIMISVAGWHNLLMMGSPGVGKSMIASRVPSVMQKMTLEERIEVSEIQSICGKLEDGLVTKRPFSAPHHSVTNSALIGGGNYPKPGEITIAHKGVLFLDELPEFNQNVLNSLRQPMEERVVKIVRNSGRYVFPADCLVIAAMNPCRCGYYPDRNRCMCSLKDIKNYVSKVNGPILDRIDMEIEVSRVKNPMDLDRINNMSSKQMSDIIKSAIDIQFRRQGSVFNGRLTTKEIQKYCALDKESVDFMMQAYEKFNLSMRGYYKIIKVARTIADIEESKNIKIEHLIEALGYRISNDYV